jgi:hypothetical protein
MAETLEVPRTKLISMMDDGTLKLGRHYAAFKGKTYSRGVTYGTAELFRRL